MNGYNHVMLMGNLGKDPVAKYTQGGSCVVNFSLAVNRKVKDKDGTWKDAVDFIPVTVWGKTAEACEKYLSKGSPVMVEGRISVTSYDDKEGKKVWRTDVIANTVNFLGTKSDGSNKPQSAPQAKPSESAPQSFREEFVDVSSDADDDIPF